MYTFEFTYTDKSYQCFEHIEKVEYTGITGDTIAKSGDELLSYKFPLSRDLHLFAKDASYMVSSKGIKFISVSKE